MAEALKIQARPTSKKRGRPSTSQSHDGHRGIRLGITIRSDRDADQGIFEAAAELIKDGKDAKPKSRVP